MLFEKLATGLPAFTLGRMFFQSLAAMAANMKPPLFKVHTSTSRTARLYDMSDLAFVVVNKHAAKWT